MVWYVVWCGVSKVWYGMVWYGMALLYILTCPVKVLVIGGGWCGMM